MKVYLATAGEYSSFRILHAFAREEDAESYKLGEDVTELELHDGPVEVRTWYRLMWRGDQPESDREANPYVEAGDLRDFDGNEKHVEHRWGRAYQQEVPGEAHLTVEGWDLALVKKVYGEQRAQYLARKEGIS